MIPFKPGFSLRCLDFPPGSPAEELALDEALLEEVESIPDTGILRFWEPSSHFVVLGYTNRADREIDLSACREREIPIYRRCTGGGTVLLGPGCLNFSLVLPVAAGSRLDTAGGVNARMMERHAAVVRRLTGKPVDVRGVSDLVIDGRKFSGNAQRRGRKAFLFHGSFLLDFAIDLIDAVLRMPTRAPAYRAGRGHGAFLVNLHVDPAALREALRIGWDAPASRAVPAPTGAAALACARYSNQAWIMK